MNAVSTTRTALSTSRQMAFFQTQSYLKRVSVGYLSLPTEILTQIVANGLDAAETVEGHVPAIRCVIQGDTFTVEDNGPGLSEDILFKSLDYGQSTSTNAKYISLTRGQQGQAIQTIWPAAFNYNDNVGSFPVGVEVGETRYEVSFNIDQLTNSAIFETPKTQIASRKGTLFCVRWPDEALDELRNESQRLSARYLFECYAFGNPHANFELVVDGKPVFQSFASKDCNRQNISAIEWYSQRKLVELIQSSVASDKTRTVRGWLEKEFVGFSSAAKRKAVVDACGVNKLSELVVGEFGEVDQEKVKLLHEKAIDVVRPTKIEKMSLIGKDRFEAMFTQYQDWPKDSIKYRSGYVVVDKIPYVIEFAAAFDETEVMCGSCHGLLNWSPQYHREVPSFLRGHLTKNRVDKHESVAVAVSVVSPAFSVSDYAKTDVTLPSDVDAKLGDMVRLCLLEFVAFKEQQDRLQAAMNKIVVKEEKKQDSFYPFCAQVMAKAYKAACGGKNYANCRQVLYKARPMVIDLMMKLDPVPDKLFYKNDKDFTQKAICKFMRDNPRLTKDWVIYYDARGHFTEPHTGIEYKVGTKVVRELIAKWDLEGGPGELFAGVLFCEKEGFDEHIADAGIRERFDIATLSTKGFSSTASRELIDALAKWGIPIYVLTDFDDSGLRIEHGLHTSSERYEFKHDPQITRIGLTLETARKLKLEPEYVEYNKPKKKKTAEQLKKEQEAISNGKRLKKTFPKNPAIRLREAGVSESDVSVLVKGKIDNDTKQTWYGERYELNALSTDQFIELIIVELETHLPNKVVPSVGRLDTGFVNQVIESRIAERTKEFIAEVRKEEIARKKDIEPPEHLDRLVQSRIQGTHDSWQNGLKHLADIHEK